MAWLDDCGELVSYVALSRRPRAWVSETDIPQDRPTCTVWIGDDEPIDTGLVTAHGTSIFRVVDRQPIGFKVPR